MINNEAFKKEGRPMKYKTKCLLSAMMVLTVLLCCLSMNAFAAYGVIGGENVKWSFDYSTNTMTISGTGDMYSYQGVFETSHSSTHLVIMPI